MIGTRAFVSAVVISLTVVGPVSAQSLKETFVAAYKNSRLLEQNRALLRATDESAAIALSALRPVLAMSGSASRSDQGGVSGATSSANLALSGSITLYDGGNSKLGLEVAKQSILAARAGLKSAEQQVLLNAATAFFGVRRAQEVVALQTNNQLLIERELEAAQDRFDVGEVTRTDVALAQARLAAVKSSLAAAQGALASARESYRLAVGKYPTNLGSAGALPNPASSVDAAKAVARKSSPSIIQAQHEVKVSDLNVQRADARFASNVGLSGSVAKNQDFDSSASVSLSVNRTLYSGGQRSALHRQAVAQQDATRAGLHYTVSLAEQSVGNAWANLQVARASLVASEEQIRAARLAFEGLREEAALGARTTLDVLDAEQDLLDAETGRAGAVNERFIAAYSLLASMGQLTVKQLNLGIATYDPAAYYESIKNAPRQSDRGLKLDNLLKALNKEQ